LVIGDWRDLIAFTNDQLQVAYGFKVMNSNLLLSDLFVDALAKGGLRHVCIAPGSRSTPLALAFAAHPDVQIHMQLDERSAGFFALGLALATDAPVATLCTSGSAAANFLPAIVEAHEAHVPLLVLTADRPPELRGSGANQTMDQLKLYGSHVLWFADMPLPEAETPALVQRHVHSMAARALATANGSPKGPVHLNFPFRKPLEPSAQEVNARALPMVARFTRIDRGKLLPAESQVADLVEVIRRHERGVIVCGPRSAGDDIAQAVNALSQASGYPVFADALSGMRTCAGVVTHYDLLLDPKVAPDSSRAFTPEVVIRFGAVPTSQVLNDALARCNAQHRIHIAGNGAWADDDFRTTWQLHADPDAVCHQVAAVLDASRKRDWLQGWQDDEYRISQAAQDELNASAWFDMQAVNAVLAALPAGARLFAGNSLSVRHVDALAQAGQDVELFGSRGVSGIDGNVSTALGIAAADAHRPTVALIGDITLIHDMNGLLPMKRLPNATIVVVNNDGGGIFHRLPIAGIDPPFTELFLTPHGLRFEHAAGLHGLRYARAESREQLQAVLREQWRAGHDAPAQLIEVITDSRADAAARTAMLKRIAARLNHSQKQENIEQV
jgi:2-succinyl-5-enolpyruvyl-6-hydroxy-3-cyclohexene-1-carboxylate synthase